MGLLDGKAAIVTGSARGIGRATAELFVSEGAKVLINDLDADVAEQTASEIDGETAVFAGDLTKADAADQLVAAGVDAFGAVDIVVNNAGYTWDGVAHRMTDEQFQAMLDIHTIVPFRVARALAPHWREAAKAERGEDKEVFRKLINVSSTSGTMGNAGQVNYSAAKMGVVGMTKTLAKEWGQFKINVNAVAFGFVDTRLTAAKEEGGEMTAPGGEKIELGIPEQMRAMASAIIPIGRPASPEEASGPVLFLASPLANYIHGQTHQRDRRHVRGHVHLRMAAEATGGKSRVPYLDFADQTWPVLRRFVGVHTFLYRATGGRLGQASRRPGQDAPARPRRRQERHPEDRPAALHPRRRERRHRRLQRRLPEEPGLVLQPHGQPRHRGPGRQPSSSAVHARDAEPEERDRLWPQLDRVWPRLRRLPGAQQGTRDPARRPRAPLSGARASGGAPPRRGRRHRRRSRPAARARPSCRGRRRS